MPEKINKVFIKTIETHWSNRCTSCCRICAKCFSPNKYKPALATWKYTEKIIENLREVECQDLQTGGDGDSFLNPIYLDSLKEIRKNYPKQRIVLYTNAFSLTPDRIERILSERLLNEINVRLDTTQPELYTWNTGMNLRVTLDNLRYFRAHNDFIDLTIIYFPLHKYAPVCRQVLGKEPVFFPEGEVKDLLREEESEVYQMIESMPGPLPIKKRRSGICFWAERYNISPIEKPKIPCKHLPENEAAFDWQCLIYPNGDLGLCSYDSGQDTFIYGNIFQDRLAEAWTGDKRKRFIHDIREGKYYGKFPCSDTRACKFYPG